MLEFSPSVLDHINHFAIVEINIFSFQVFELMYKMFVYWDRCLFQIFQRQALSYFFSFFFFKFIFWVHCCLWGKFGHFEAGPARSWLLMENFALHVQQICGCHVLCSNWRQLATCCHIAFPYVPGCHIMRHVCRLTLSCSAPLAISFWTLISVRILVSVLN